MTDFRFHIGVHKTGTTQIQEILSLNRENLNNRKVCYIETPECRKLFQFDEIEISLLSKVYNRFKLPAFTQLQFFASEFQRKASSHILKKFSTEICNYDSLVFSDENIIGLSSDIISKKIYPNKKNISILNNISQHHRIKIYICIRKFSEIFPSAYAQSLRTIDADQLLFKKTIDNYTKRTPSWIPFLYEIKNFAPKSEIFVWDFDFYKSNIAQICSIICGADLPNNIVVKRPEITQSPSAHAIRIAEKIHIEDWKKRRKVINEIYRQYPIKKTEDKFEPFSANQKADLDKSHQEELIKIKEIPFINFID